MTTTTEGYKKPLPPMSPVDRPFAEGCAEGQLRLQTCRNCGRKWFPPAANCPNCLSTDYSWEPARGTGVLWSWIVMHQRYIAGFADDIPYIVALVELDEGPRLMSTIVGSDPAELRCGMALTAAFQRVTEERFLPVFRVAPAG